MTADRRRLRTLQLQTPFIISLLHLSSAHDGSSARQNKQTLRGKNRRASSPKPGRTDAFRRSQNSNHLVAQSYKLLYY